MSNRFLLLALASMAIQPAIVGSQPRRPLMPIEHVNSAEFRWLDKPVHASRMLDDMTDSSTWRMSGRGVLTFPRELRPGGIRVLRVDMTMAADSLTPTRGPVASVNLRRQFDGEDWSGYNRISLWVRPDFSGVPTLPLQLVMHNDGVEKVPDVYGREGRHFVTLAGDGWQQIVWEIEPLARDRVTLFEIGYWVNKTFAGPGDSVAFEIGRMELQRVDPDHHTGWSVAPGRISFSHAGYDTDYSKTAFTSGLASKEFQLVRVDNNALGDVVLRRPVQTVQSRIGEFQHMDFSDVRTPGTYVVRAGDARTHPFRIAGDPWEPTVRAALNFFYGNRCGFDVPGSHGVDHLDWFATHGGQRIVMSGGWHDAGDLSQGIINTGEATYALFELAERLEVAGGDPALVERVLEEAKWGLDWVLRVRFPGGYRMYFSPHNLWTNNVVGDADDREREALNNPNANYISAAAAAIAYRVLKDRDPGLAERSLRIAEDDWAHAIVGVESAETRHTPAFAATPMELAGIGITASLELFRATGNARYTDKAVELARIVAASQQRRPVGAAFPLAGFFFTGPDRDTVFHQFHRGNDQAPIVAMAQLLDALPDHQDWMTWYSVVARYADYQKKSAETTAPYSVLPSYVYRLSDDWEVPEAGGLHRATRESYREQVVQGMPMGDGWYLRTFPVWYARRGNFGSLLSQAKALATGARVRNDSAAADLAHQQAQWIMGRNPFVQSTIYGVGYEWSQQYSVSSGDFVGSLIVGMQSRGATDLPYWPTQNGFVYKEVWIHSASRWLWLMADLAGGMSRTGPIDTDQFTVTSTTAANGEVTIRLVTDKAGAQTFALRSDNLVVDRPNRTVQVRQGSSTTIEWKGRPGVSGEGWVAVVVPNGDVQRRREVIR